MDNPERSERWHQIDQKFRFQAINPEEVRIYPLDQDDKILQDFSRFLGEHYKYEMRVDSESGRVIYLQTTVTEAIRLRPSVARAERSMQVFDTYPEWLKGWLGPVFLQVLKNSQF